MSLKRLAFWLVLLVVLLPTDAGQQARFTSFASAAMERLSTFCDRNVSTCELGSAAWATFVRKAEFGMRLVGDLLGAGGRPPPGQAPEVDTDVPTAYKKRPGKRLGRVEDPDDTLAPSDYRPPWRAPQPTY